LDVGGVEFVGSGSNGGNITRYVWNSTIDGEIYNGTEGVFTASGLSWGNHTISMRVQDERGVWSDPVHGTMICTERPRAEIIHVPTLAVRNENMSCLGKGVDDGTIVKYVWRSSIDGIFYEGEAEGFTYSHLSSGNHTIYFKVQDDRGVWSEELSSSLIVNRRPVIGFMQIGGGDTFKINDVTISESDHEFHVGAGDYDGILVRYVWSSSIDGEFYNGTKANITYHELTKGEHIITVKVQDDLGTWSEERSLNMTKEIDFYIAGESGMLVLLCYAPCGGVITIVVIFLVMKRKKRSDGSLPDGGGKASEGTPRVEDLMKDLQPQPSSGSLPGETPMPVMSHQQTSFPSQVLQQTPFPSQIQPQNSSPSPQSMQPSMVPPLPQQGTASPDHAPHSARSYSQQPQSFPQTPSIPSPPPPQSSPPGSRIPPKVECLNCGEVIVVDGTRVSREGKVQIQCPKCGVKGSL